ncbi:hypothetical protein [Edaphobacter sp. 12200R-103]|uniref:hypothetical protein n=1 Tax=Edaphobacter sp. 12200R-103 TaxID=2703788 RepID=UPI00138C78F4|nr:hypothetical protein [Edaphobacter sp. 12200R-103]QHS51152.1 hypothetical protein GWR55_04940 [Edaphobacter sp. 12200R-103]
MKIACSILGIEGLQSAPALGHSVAGVSTVSFAESLGESLTKVITDAGEKPIKPEILIVKAGKPDQKMAGEPERHPVEAVLSGRLKLVTKGVAVLNEQVSLAGQSTNPGMTSDDIPATPVQNDAPEKVSSGKVAEISKLDGPASALDESSEAQAERSAEQEGVPREPVVAASNGRDHRETDSTKKIEHSVKASSPATVKEKGAKVTPHHKTKRDSKHSPIEGQRLQQNSPGDSPGMVQTIAAAGSVLTAPAVAQTVLDRGSQNSSVDVEPVMPSGRKVVAAHSARKGPHDQPALKPPGAPGITAGETSGKPAEAPLRENRTLTEATASKTAAGDDKSLVEDRSHAALQTAPVAGASGLQPTLHAPAPQPPDKIAVAAPAHLAHMPPPDSPASQTIYAPGEHGTISATPTALEVGIPGGTHGWLKVRAEIGGDGSVHASMSSNSAAGTEALRRELPQLTSYLHQEQVRVSSVVVHTPHNPTEFSNQTSGDGRGQAMNGGPPDTHRGDAGRSGGQGASHSQARISQTPLVPEADVDLLLPRGFGSAGGWLSVRA